VESTGSSTCIIRNRLRGRHLFPLADVFGKELWDLLIPPILDNDLQDVAFAVGAIERKQPVQLPPLAGVLQRLSRAREINGVPAGEFFTSSG
jgi:hypothetical protein